ncbi:hypothetical protein ONS95_000924 [Cadophora gregata]|uniref:uncharacterized protein n=1 Tax=Cadophora gregata TaxID=51156 RepID=UPI0026DB560B|nr:uncharacterized protein ONS95_000924 [Cadophora gregata]KAK0102880.1 hypothetical protein ONS96_005509 [Cadophora gregata f. sp. sojae]KAK0128981.1 hypothetical protein ONS95_000924 [Cadophora gregata]
MSSGFSVSPKSTFPDEEPPTLFHPASPRMKPVKQPLDDGDRASISTSSTFSSKIGLLKDTVKSKIPSPYKDYRSRKEAAARSTVTSREVKRLPSEMKTPRQATAEAYMIWAAIR